MCRVKVGRQGALTAAEDRGEQGRGLGSGGSAVVSCSQSFGMRYQRGWGKRQGKVQVPSLRTAWDFKGLICFEYNFGKSTPAVVQGMDGGGEGA